MKIGTEHSNNIKRPFPNRNKKQSRWKGRKPPRGMKMIAERNQKLSDWKKVRKFGHLFYSVVVLTFYTETNTDRSFQVWAWPVMSERGTLSAYEYHLIISINPYVTKHKHTNAYRKKRERFRTNVFCKKIKQTELKPYTSHNWKLITNVKSDYETFPSLLIEKHATTA